MVKIDRVIHNKFKANSYFFIEDDKCVVIDCNMNTLNYLCENRLQPVYLFVTHEHFDHIEGIKLVKEHFPEMIIIASKTASGLMADAKSNMSFYFDGVGIEEIEADMYIEDTSSFMFNEHAIQTYYTPGHTAGSIIISIDDVLFTGDTVLDVKTPTTLPNSSKKQLRESIEFIDSHFDDNTIFYQGHGKPFVKKDWDKDITTGAKKKED